MDKAKVPFATFAFLLIFFGWLLNSSIRDYREEIDFLRNSIVEARYLIESPDKEDIKEVKMILENAQNYLESRDAGDTEPFEPFIN